MKTATKDKKRSAMNHPHTMDDNNDINLPEIVFISSFPPRECGIATYSQDLTQALTNKFNGSFKISICALESKSELYSYEQGVDYVLNKDKPGSFEELALLLNANPNIEMVMLQHEFGLFAERELDLLIFLEAVKKPIIISFHTLLPQPNDSLKTSVTKLCESAEGIVVMTNSSAKILRDDYGIQEKKISVIQHGTHLLSHADKNELKEKYHLSGKKILSTFGLLSSGKSIETSLNALPGIIKDNPNVLFLIIGKTHPSVVQKEGEVYRDFLEEKVMALGLGKHVKFINRFVPLDNLLEYLQLTDIYLFTSKDPNQAVSGTFSYAISCGCAIISSPIPHALEVLKDDAGIIVNFEDSSALTAGVNLLLKNESLRMSMSSNGLHKMASTAWENTAISYALLFKKVSPEKIDLHYTIPEINLDHIKKLSSDFGMIQFSNINQPDIDSGYTLDDNARALIALCQYYEQNKDETVIPYIHIYLKFIKHCLQTEGYFLNYVNEEKKFTDQNNSTNLADSNGRAIWALGYLISIDELLPIKNKSLGIEAESILKIALLNVNKIHSTRAMAFIIKGLYYQNKNKTGTDVQYNFLIRELSDRLVQMYKHETKPNWEWFESYLTYANSVLPEALLCAWLNTRDPIYKEIAKSSFDFLLSKTFIGEKIKVISNKHWMDNEGDKSDFTIGGEQPIDVSYTIIALSKFYNVFKTKDYSDKIKGAFDWFLGGNHLNQIIYNPCTGGCYDGLEESYVNLNQGAESTVSYLMARMTIQDHLSEITNNKIFLESKHVILESEKQYM